MKKLLLFIVIFISSFTLSAQRGKYAGTKRSLLGKTYTDSRIIPGLKGWTYTEGSLLNQINDPEYITADVFKKGTTYVVILSIKEDTASDKYSIYDVIEITGVAKGWDVRVGTCSQFKQADAYIIAWGKETQDEYMKLIKKAWRFDPDKRRVISIPIKTIECENIGC